MLLAFICFQSATHAGPPTLKPVYWVGYQNDCMIGFPDVASFYHGDNWFNYTVPGPEDVAIFGSEFDPHQDGYPQHVYFGSFCINFASCPNPTIVVPPQYDRYTRHAEVRTGKWVFDVSWGASGCPNGGYCGYHSFDALTLGGNNSSLPTTTQLTLTQSDVCSPSYRGFGAGSLIIGDKALDDATMELDGINLSANSIDIASDERSMGMLICGNSTIYNEWGEYLVVGKGGRGTLVATSCYIGTYVDVTIGLGALSHGEVELVGEDSLLRVVSLRVGVEGSGSLRLIDGAVIEVDYGGLFHVGPQGNVRGAGRVKIMTTFINEGRVSPGTSVAPLQIIGDFQQNEPGVLEIELGQSVRDHLAISGHASLGGVLRVLHASTFNPQVKERYSIVSYLARSGGFATSEGMYLGGGRTLQAVYRPDGVTLEVRKLGDFDGDGVIGITDQSQFVLALRGPDERAIPPEYTPGDLSEDGTIDMLDFAGFQNSIED